MRLMLAFACALTLAGAAAAQTEPAPIEDANWAALQSYAGVWISEEKTREDGGVYRFRYTLEPFDARGRILEMTIEMIEASGEETLLWRGFKGWDGVQGQVFYNAASPSGRFAEGHVALDDEGALVTAYRGVDPVQGEAQIRDVFTTSGPNSFTAVTYMLRDGEWTEILRDAWTRVPGSETGG